LITGRHEFLDGADCYTVRFVDKRGNVERRYYNGLDLADAETNTTRH
jgi:hypothetical protein